MQNFDSGETTKEYEGYGPGLFLGDHSFRGFLLPGKGQKIGRGVRGAERNYGHNSPLEDSFWTIVEK